MEPCFSQFILSSSYWHFQTPGVQYTDTYKVIFVWHILKGLYFITLFLEEKSIFDVSFHFHRTAWNKRPFDAQCFQYIAVLLYHAEFILQYRNIWQNLIRSLSFLKTMINKSTITIVYFLNLNILFSSMKFFFFFVTWLKSMSE